MFDTTFYIVGLLLLGSVTGFPQGQRDPIFLFCWLERVRSDQTDWLPKLEGKGSNPAWSNNYVMTDCRAGYRGFSQDTLV